MRTLAILTTLLAWVAHAQAQDTLLTNKQEMHRIQQDPKAYIARLENPTRDAYQKPDAVVKALQITPGEVIADIGAGSGYFTFRFARHVGTKGRVYAVDVSSDMIAAISQKMSSLPVGTLAPILARPDDPLLPAGKIDLVFICDTWHHIDDRVAYAGKLESALAPGGRVVIVDFHKRDIPVGPNAAMKLAREDVLKDFESAGFVLSKEHTMLPYQYFLEFTSKR